MDKRKALVVDDEFRQIINVDSTVNNMRRAFRQSGWPNLFEDGLQKVKRGVTTIEEILRVAEVADAADALTSEQNAIVDYENNPPESENSVQDSVPVCQVEG